jgi:FtsH-binding integral membrane protein
MDMADVRELDQQFVYQWLAVMLFGAAIVVLAVTTVQPGDDPVVLAFASLLAVLYVGFAVAERKVGNGLSAAGNLVVAVGWVALGATASGIVLPDSMFYPSLAVIVVGAIVGMWEDYGPGAGGSDSDSGSDPDAGSDSDSGSDPDAE